MMRQDGIADHGARKSKVFNAAQVGKIQNDTSLSGERVGYNLTKPSNGVYSTDR